MEWVFLIFHIMMAHNSFAVDELIQSINTLLVMSCLDSESAHQNEQYAGWHPHHSPKLSPKQ